MEYTVTCPRGVAYLDGGFNGGELAIFPTGTTIRQKDIDKGFVSVSGLQALEKRGRVKQVLGTDTKPIKGGSHK